MRSLLLLLFLVPFLSKAQDLSLYEKHVFERDGDSMPYRLLLPENYDASKEYPIVFFLHGAGERGSDNEKQLTHGAKLFLRADVRKNYPAIVVFPQCSQDSYWSSVGFKFREDSTREFVFPEEGEPTKAMWLAQALLFHIMESYPVKEEQVYVGGLSMGGMGTFELVWRNPDLVAAAFPICGGGNTTNAYLMKDTDWWIFHGAKDDIVPPSLSEEMVEALQQAGAVVEFSLYPNANHNSWDAAFAEPELLPWLFSKRK